MMCSTGRGSGGYSTTGRTGKNGVEVELEERTQENGNYSAATSLVARYVVVPPTN